MNRASMCSRLMSLGLTKQESSDIITQIGKWVRCNGEEWTVKRFKDLNSLYLHRIAGSKNFKPNLWLALDNNGLPKGPMKRLFRGSSRRNFSKVLTGLKIYSVFIAEEMTKDQRTKFFGSMESPVKTGLSSYPKLGMDPSWFARRQEGLGLRPITLDSRCPPTFLEYCTSGKRGPSGFSETGKTEYETNHMAMFLHGARSYQVRKIVGEFKDHFDSVIPVHDFFNQKPFPSNEGPAHNVGVISVIQEPGYKSRLVANPSRVIQAALEPLKEDITNALRVLPTDVTHDQFSAIKPIQNWLKEGMRVHSIDLSDATNLFPWKFQKEMLKLHFHGDRQRTMIEIMDRVSKSDWGTTLKTGEFETVSFTRGQPQGLGPSFAAFAFTHNLLLAGMCHKRKLVPSKTFRVLGDDVVINNDEVARAYRMTLNNLGCKVSEGKSFSSRYLAEFAGYTITPRSYGKGYKWRNVSDRSFFDFVKNLGPNSVGYLNPAQRTVAKFLLKGHKAMGGLGVNPGPLDEFLIKFTTSKEVKDMVIPYRDLYQDCLTFVSNIPGPPPPTWVPVWYEEGVGRKAFDLLDFWHAPRLKAVQKTFLERKEETPLKGSCRIEDLKPHQYVIRHRDGDPRQSNVAYLRRLLTEVQDDPHLKGDQSRHAKLVSALHLLTKEKARNVETEHSRPRRKRKSHSPRKGRSM